MRERKIWQDIHEAADTRTEDEVLADTILNRILGINPSEERWAQQCSARLVAPRRKPHVVTHPGVKKALKKLNADLRKSRMHDDEEDA